MKLESVKRAMKHVKWLDVVTLGWGHFKVIDPQSFGGAITKVFVIGAFFDMLSFIVRLSYTSLELRFILVTYVTAMVIQLFDELWYACATILWEGDNCGG